MKQILLLGSKSPSRKELLVQSKISFEVIQQDADETVCDWNLPLEQLVKSIALHKMAHVILPTGNEGDVCFVLTADTLSQDMDGNIHGKPIDRKDARIKIIAARKGSRLCTGFCLDKKVWIKGKWQVEKRIEKQVSAHYLFDIPDEWIDRYLDNSVGLHASNAIAIEGYGGQFLRSVQGSYTTIVGLPLYELRQALEQIGFF